MVDSQYISEIAWSYNGGSLDMVENLHNIKKKKSEGVTRDVDYTTCKL